MIYKTWVKLMGAIRTFVKKVFNGFTFMESSENLTLK